MYCPTFICLEDMFTFFMPVEELMDFSLFFCFCFLWEKNDTVEDEKLLQSIAAAVKKSFFPLGWNEMSYTM